MLHAGTITDVRVIMVTFTAICIELFIYIELRKKAGQNAGRESECLCAKSEDTKRKTGNSRQKKKKVPPKSEDDVRSEVLSGGKNSWYEEQAGEEMSKETAETDPEQTTLLVCDCGGNAGHTYRRNIRLIRGLWEKSAYLGSNGIVIGRYPQECDIVIDDISVSRRHMKIYEKDDVVYLEDIGSTNGTVLNGERIYKDESYKIYDGDVIRIGGQEYHIQILLI